MYRILELNPQLQNFAGDIDLGEVYGFSVLHAACKQVAYHKNEKDKCN